MKNLALFALPLVALVFPSASSYSWPSPVYDEIEDLLYLQTGYLARNFADPITPCSKPSGDQNGVAAAEWIRVAFHDMAGYNMTTKSGGLDASIMFELNFNNNDGKAFNSTFNTLKKHYNMHASMSDLLAVSTYAAVRACGGGIIPVRAGRIDATEPYPVDGGPTPSKTAAELNTIFNNIGFSTSDMVKMVACGHTMGGVHGGDAPTVLANNTEGNFVAFDTTSATFDNKIVTEYIAQTTQNPLVVGPDPSLMSDAKVFTIDNNVTAKALTDPATFQAACVDVFTRMIDTVGKNVTLSPVITPITVKPYPKLELNSGGKLQFSGKIRVHNDKATDLNKEVKHVVNITYADETLKTSGTIETVHVGSARGFDDSFEFYSFNTELAGSFHHFDVTVDGVVYNNNGTHYMLEDNVLFQKEDSCISSLPDAAGNYTINVVAVTKPSNGSNVAPTPKMSGAISIPQTGYHSQVVPRLMANFWNMTQLTSAEFVKGSEYTAWQASASIPGWMLPTKIGVSLSPTDLDIFYDTGSLPKC